MIIFNYTIRVLVRWWQKERPEPCVETLYLKGLYERLTLPSGNVEHKYYVGNTVVIDSTDAKQSKTLYTHKDHLGSTVTVTDANGSVVQHINYDAWGKQNRFYTSSSLVSLLNQQSPVESKGYTGHKEISDLGIIHMNGRIYDPTLGRFLQADPHIQAPTNSQNYNRYSYVLNNPLSYTDPSGYFFKKLLRSIAKIPILNMAIQAVMAVYCQVCLVAYNAMSTYAVTGSLKAAFTSAIVSIASPGGGSFGGIVATGVIGGLASKAQGGNFGHGFWSAGLGAAMGGRIQTGNAYANVVVSAVVGGTVSKLTGGKFANGAQTWAFSAAMAQDWSSTRGQFNNNADVVGGYKKSVDAYGSQEASFKLSDDLSLDYTVSGSEGFADDVASYISGLSTTSTGHEILTGLAESGTGLAIYENIGQSAATGRGFFDFSWDKTIIALDPRTVRAPAGLFQTLKGKPTRPYVPAQHTLGHELVHAWQNTSWSNGAPQISHNISGRSPWETQAAAYTNLIRQQQGYRYRRVIYD